MNEDKIVFKKKYDGESLFDFYRDMEEAFDERLNSEIKSIPVDEYNLFLGEFEVTIKWKDIKE